MLGAVGRFLAAAVVVALVALPVAAEQAVERTSFDDAIGTLPVEMSLCRQGRSTLSTGILGDVHWEESGAWGLGIRARVTGPPEAGGTLASYADRRFVRANVQFIDDPDAAVSAYAGEFRDRLTSRVLVTISVAGVVGGALVLVVARFVSVSGSTARRRRLLAAAVAASFVVSAAGAVVLFQRWPCNGDGEPAHRFPGVPELAFSSPQTLELALQVEPFIVKNSERIKQRSEDYQEAVEASFSAQLSMRGDQLRPRAGEVVVSAEADPQGAFVGAAVRAALYPQLLDRLGPDALVLRTLSGDITSNGTVAEDDFVAAEVAAGGDIPTVAVSGDHDSEQTRAQMGKHGMVVPDLSTEEVGGLRVSGANDVEHKALFGQLVTNESGVSEWELGRMLREEVPSEPGIVLLHQPDAVAGYLGVESLSRVRELDGSLTTPYDDGIPDVPPGTVNIGHLHDLDGPWVLWNTDGDDVTWTVVDQLGTTGGVEERPTFNRFSTPVSVPLKAVSWRLQYVNRASGLQTGFVTISCDVNGACRIGPRVDVGLRLDEDGRVESG